MVAGGGGAWVGHWIYQHWGNEIQDLLPDPPLTVTHILARPPGYWPGDKGAEERGRRNGIGATAGRRRFHNVKGGCPGSRVTDNFSVNPQTCDVLDPEGDVVGNLADAKSK